MRRATFLGLILAGSAAVSACHPVRTAHFHFGGRHGRVGLDHPDAPLAVAARLDCPDEEGELKRVSQSGDGSACRYQGEDGRQVDLRLLALNGAAPEAGLKPVEAELASLVPLAAVGVGAARIDAHEGGASGDRTRVDLPGLHIDAGGDKADVKVLGADIDADGDRADVKLGFPMRGTEIHAGPGGAEVRAGEVGKYAAELFYVRESEAKDAVVVAGYEARGPVQGPLVVGEFRSHDRSDRNGGGADLRRLVDRNLKAAAG